MRRRWVGEDHEIHLYPLTGINRRRIIEFEKYRTEMAIESPSRVPNYTHIPPAEY